MSLKPLYVNLVRGFASNLGVKAKVTIDGTIKDCDIFRTSIEEESIKKFVYIDEGVGHITEAKLVDSSERELDVKSLDIQKGEDGYMIVFQTSLKIEEGSNGD